MIAGWCPFLFLSSPLNAQNPFKGLEHLFVQPLQYTAGYTAKPPFIDGDIETGEWAKVPWSTLFTDIEGEKRVAPKFQTRFKMQWDKDFLYIAADMQEPHVWAYLDQHDQVVFNDNDFEVFIDPDNNTHQYFEIEVNALNNVFDLFLSKPYRNHSAPLISWDAPGMRSAVKVYGTLNDPSDTDRGWTVEMAIPYAAVSVGNHPNIPKEGDFWRINFSRVEWETDLSNGRYVRRKDSLGKQLPEHNWVWSPQGVIDMHRPERWGYLRFAAADEAESSFELPFAEQQKKYLWLVYYKQKAYFEQHRCYASSLRKLGIPKKIRIQKILHTLEMDAGKHQFDVRLTADQQQTVYINQDGLVQTLNQ
ncbi:carbohydrate-binding family 9-like protein [Pedobacter sp. AW31-3R]|uniref:carbohydrate-binding family 9-like protein n=1 Tax=Pedobacter sp. AW31-3R TaxID=3445781 RepID=UPI003F9F3165